MRTVLTLLLLALGAAACQSVDNQTLATMFRESTEELVEDGGMQSMSRSTAENMARRRTRVRELFDAREITTGKEHTQAAFILISSTDLEELELAYVLALRAVELGDERALPLSGEALDRAMVRRGLPQKYGTQFTWEPVLQKWRLYPTDPTTTDEDRKLLGLPTMAELYAFEGQMNGEEVPRQR